MDSIARVLMIIGGASLISLPFVSVVLLWKISKIEAAIKEIKEATCTNN